MKITVAQVMDYDKKVRLLEQDLDSRIKACETPEQRGQLHGLLGAVQAMRQMAESLKGVSMTVKG